MKKVLIFSIAILVFASCGNSGYSPITRTNDNSQPATPTDSDPLSAFNTMWTSDGVPTGTAQEKRALANFFGYNTAHYANVADNCYYGYTDETSMWGWGGVSCFSSTHFLRNYFPATTYFIYPSPAPKDLGSVTGYSIKFGANVDEATRELVEGGNVYLKVTIDSSSATLTREFTTTTDKVSITTDTHGNQHITASLKDDCGKVTFSAVSESSGVLSNASITFKQDKASYKKAACYHSGTVPNGVELNTDITDALPNGVNGMLFVGGVEDFVEQ